VDAFEFFNTVLPSAGLRCIALVAPKGFQHIFYKDNQSLADAAALFDGKGRTVYFACSSFASDDNRTQANVAYARSFWVDLDVGEPEPGKLPKYPTAREAASAVLAFAQEVGLPRPLLVSSGRGVHAYWPMDGDMMRDVWKTTARLLKAALREHKVLSDPTRTADEASVLRPPGTHHRKAEARVVRVVTPGEVGNLNAFQTALMPYAGKVEMASDGADSFLPEGGPAAGLDTFGSNKDLSEGVGGRKADADLIASKCAVVELIRDTRGKVDQPTWYKGLQLLQHTTGGHELAHEWSKGDPRYSAAETDAKLKQVAKYGPPLCSAFSDLHPAKCAACPHADKVKTPFTLGLAQGETIDVETKVLTPRGWQFTRKTLEAPWGFRYTTNFGHSIMQAQMYDDSGEPAGWDTFCETLVVPVTRLWIEGVAYVEFEMDLQGQEKRRFLIEGGLIGKGRDSLAAELARNEVVICPGKGNYMDTYLKRWMQSLKESANLVVAHKHFGWEHDDFVLGDTILQADGGENRGVMVGVAKSKLPALTPRGDLQTWVDTIDKAYNAPGQEAFQFLVACSFAAPLLQLMGQVQGVTVYAHSEGSGVGKTTAQRAGLSAWGDWEDLMLADKKITENALWAIIGTYANLPVVFDELTNMQNSIASDLVFSVSSGRAKQRMNASGELRENNNNWCTIMMASGNNLLSEKLSLHRGNAEAEISRLFEFTVDVSPHLTPNEAMILFPKLRTNCGYAGLIYARHLVDHRAQITAMLAQVQSKLNTQLGITQMERYWSALIASTLVAVSICRNLGLLDFDLAGLKKWLIARLAENRGSREENTSDALELFGTMMADLWQGVLVTNGEGDLRGAKAATVVQPPRGVMVGRAIVPVARNEQPVLILSGQAVKDWANKKGVSAREMFLAVVREGWAEPDFVRYSLGRGTVEYSQTSSYLGCWLLHPDRISGAAGATVAQKFGVVDGGLAGGAAQQ
jgi:hypothetical protein